MEISLYHGKQCSLLSTFQASDKPGRKKELPYAFRFFLVCNITKRFVSEQSVQDSERVESSRVFVLLVLMVHCHDHLEPFCAVDAAMTDVIKGVMQE